MAIQTEKIEIKIDGKKDESYNYLNIVLIQELLKPNELRFTMQKKDFSVTADDCRFTKPKELMGKKVTLTVETSRFNNDFEIKNETLEFEGIIFNIKVYREEMSTEQLIDVTVFSPDYLLIDHSHCISYENKKLNDVVSATVEPYDFKKKVDADIQDTFPYWVQYNETNYQFLIRLAHRFGEWMYYDGKKWIFGKMDVKAPIDLYPGVDLLDYRYETDLMHQAVIHGHHDYLKYKNPTKNNGDFPTFDSPLHSLTDKAREQSKTLFTKTTFQHTQCSNPEEANFGEANEVNISAGCRLAGERAQQTVCTGTTNRADLTIGSCFKIKDLSDNDGDTHGHVDHDELRICRIVHVVDVEGYYRNEFTANPANTIRPPYFNSDVFPVASPQRAIVRDNEDPRQLGRVRVQFLWQEEQDKELITPWIRIAQPYGGDDKGFYYIPEIDEEVMVGFENSNAEKPFVIGTLWHGKQKPDQNKWSAGENKDNNIKAIRTRAGHTIEIHDKEDTGGFIRIYDHKRENYVLTFSTDKKLIRLESSGNIELCAAHNIIMEAGNNIVLAADEACNRPAYNPWIDYAEGCPDKGNIFLFADSHLSYTAEKNNIINIGGNQQNKIKGYQVIEVDGDQVTDVGGDQNTTVGGNKKTDVKGKQTTDVKGDKEENITGSYKLKAMSMKFEANSSIEFKSITYKQEGSATTEIKGGIVKIN